MKKKFLCLMSSIAVICVIVSALAVPAFASRLNGGGDTCKHRRKIYTNGSLYVSLGQTMHRVIVGEETKVCFKLTNIYMNTATCSNPDCGYVFPLPKAVCWISHTYCPGEIIEFD